MQLLAKFKKILYMGFRATLNFQKKKFHSAIFEMTMFDHFKDSYKHLDRFIF